MEPSPSNPQTLAKLKLAGTFSGTLEIDISNSTTLMLREEIAKRLSCDSQSINLICGGKVLKDCDEKLGELGVKNGSKILVTKVATDGGGKCLGKELKDEEERSRLLDRIKAAATALAERHAEGSLPLENFNIELEDQSGQKVHFGSETARQGVMMGLMLHAKAKRLIQKKMYKEALEVLIMGEESFSLCDAKFLEMIDNVSILQIDMVWCYFMLRDIKWLSMAGVRLGKARQGIERSYGKDLSRVRILSGNCCPELALFLRLELLEGVVAYHSGEIDKCRKALTSAGAKLAQLEISDESLSLIMAMGYKEKETKRALRMNMQDVERAVGFLVEENEKKAQRREEDLRREREIMEQKRYGMTPLKKAVNIERLNELVSIGFEKSIAGEALRRNENDTQKALDDLTNPEIIANIQLYIDSRNAKRLRQATDAIIEELVSMGFERSRVVAAVRATGTQERALDLLTSGTEPEPNLNPTVAEQGSSDPNQTQNLENPAMNSDIAEDIENPTSSTGVIARDVEMEDELAGDITGDAFSDYDIEVAEEGQAIAEYLALLDSSGN
ncbi:hypothetical protein ACHQM5_028938 [Ranunculus cassubicifolius]